jgi:hypothetical protein
MLSKRFVHQSNHRIARVLQLASKVQIEQLEQRIMLSSTVTDIENPSVPPQPLPIQPEPYIGVVGTPESMNPQLFTEAFGFNDIYFDNGGTITRGDGAGETIAIVDAFGSPTIIQDAQTFDNYWGLSNYDSNGQFFLTVQPLSKTPYSENDSQDIQSSWAGETALDVEWAHTVAPGAHILLIEAPSQSFMDLILANAYAAAQPGVVVVSNSWGYPVDELTDPFVEDGYLVTPNGHLDSDGLQGDVAFFASSGDLSAEYLYPAASEDVISIGGTNSVVDINGNLDELRSWADADGEGSGGATDTLYGEPGYNEPLVSLDADPATGVWVYSSTPVEGLTGWIQGVGGTSLSCPCWAAYTAIIDQGLAEQGLPSMSSGTLTDFVLNANEDDLADALATFDTIWVYPTTYPLYPTPPGVPTAAVTPSNGNTGWGIPVALGFANYVLGDMVIADGTAIATADDYLTFTQQPTNTTAGDDIAPAIKVEVDSSATGQLDTSYVGSVTLALGANSGGTLNGTATETVINGVATFSNLSINQLGDYVLYASAPDANPQASSPFAVGPSVSQSLAIGSEPTSAWQYGDIPIVVDIEDTFGNLNITDTSTVRVAINSGPAGAVLSGTTQVRASTGIATFSDLSLNLPGKYTLKFTDGALPAVVTASFQVVPIPGTRHYLFNGVALSSSTVLLQQQRNSVVYTDKGPPTQAEINAALAAEGAALFSNGYVAAAPVVAPAFSTADSTVASSAVSQILDGSAASGDNQLLDN